MSVEPDKPSPIEDHKLVPIQPNYPEPIKADISIETYNPVVIVLD